MTTSTKRRRSRAFSIAGSILIVVSIVLTPVAIIGAWARVQLVDTNSFVSTLAPLAEKPEVQRFLAAQVNSAIEQNVDIDGLVNDVFVGIGELDLPPRTQSALQLLEAPAAAGVRSLLSSGVDAIVTSPAFATIWEGTLRQVHQRAIAVIQGDPNSALHLGAEGTLSISLGPMIAEVKILLIDQGLGFATLIPEVDRNIPLMHSESLLLIRSLYEIATNAGFWLPWVLLGIFVLGVCLTRRRLGAVALGAFGFTLVLLLHAGGIGIGRLFVVNALSPGTMPGETASAMYGQLTQAMRTTVITLAVIGLMVAIAAWVAGDSAAARALRRTVVKGFNNLRAASGRLRRPSTDTTSTERVP